MCIHGPTTANGLGNMTLVDMMCIVLLKIYCTVCSDTGTMTFYIFCMRSYYVMLPEVGADAVAPMEGLADG